ncbi:c-type cytochrome [Sulfurimonas autotrophica]|uniref:Cytochrome c oxidase subunit III n=1 Tax=Sulfurimonas autotrophica (strain ATCC BAA-671 / DSM 16294 / JCM 11897 / OK10) TaxID=563040 RepID=E0UR49_SULAO|nr:c-type cytochrome [Sulfurimonas autotrophica]ADN10005.1 cytochrome c class I [Sulfurimonas autotrophica DSM 16294]
MNKLYLWGIIITAAMLGATYATVGYQKGGLNGDIVNMLAIAGAVALVIITIFVVIKYVRQMQVDHASGELADESWDNIGEYKNPVPFGWAIMFLGTMIWGMWYFTIGYPVNAFSQIGQYNEEVKEKDAEFEKKYANIKGEQLVNMGESVYLVECVACHGLNADGNNEIDAADLNQRISEKSIKYVINHGSNNKLLGTEMPMPDRNGLFNAETGALITDKEIDEVAKYVAGGLKDTNSAGANVFANVCAACHGPDGKGMAYVAPDIATWNKQLVINVLDNGKQGAIGKMPAMDRLNPKQKEAIAAYVMSLSKGE